MATAARDYYKNLLVSQYFGLPKATQTIEMITDMLFAEDVLLDIERLSLDFNKSGGKNLDQIASVVGLKRDYAKDNRVITLSDNSLREAIKLKILKMNIGDSSYDIQKRLNYNFGSSSINGTERLSSDDIESTIRSENFSHISQGIINGELITSVLYRVPNQLYFYRGLDFSNPIHTVNIASTRLGTSILNFPHLNLIVFLSEARVGTDTFQDFFTYNQSSNTITTTTYGGLGTPQLANGSFAQDQYVHYYSQTESIFKVNDYTTGQPVMTSDSDLFSQFNGITFTNNDRFFTDLKYFYKYSIAGGLEVYEFTTGTRIIPSLFFENTEQNDDSSISSIFVPKDEMGQFTDKVYIKPLDFNTGAIHKFEAYEYVNVWPSVALHTDASSWSPASSERISDGVMNITYEFDETQFSEVLIDYLVENDILPRPTGVALHTISRGVSVEAPFFGFTTYKERYPIVKGIQLLHRLYHYG